MAGSIILDVIANKNSLNKQLKNLEKDGSRTGKSLEKGMLPSLAKIGAAIAGAFTVGKIVSFGKSCIDLGSDLAEVQNVVDVTFGSMSDQINEYAKNAMTVSGLSETMAKQFAGSFGAMSKAFGFSTGEAYEMSTALTSLAGDVASFYNLDHEEAYTKLKSVFTGETESLKDLGVVMTQTALDSYALANGFGKTTSAMTEAEKVSLRYAFVQDRLSAASGDFQRTSGGWANQVRVLTLQFESLKATIGQGLINLFTPIIKAVNSLIGRLSVLAESFKSFTEMISGGSSDGGGLSASASAAADLAESTAGVEQSAKAASKSMRSLMGFDEVNKVSESSEDSSDTASAGGSAVSFGAIDTSGLGTVDTSGLDKLSSRLEILRGTDLEPLMNSLGLLKGSFGDFGDTIGDGLGWLLENVLQPIANWTIEEALPTFFTTLGKALEFINTVLEECAPYFEQFFDDVIAPLGEFVGDAIVRVWEDIGIAFDFFAGVLRDNPTLAAVISAIGIAIGTVAAAMALVNLVAAINPFGLIVIAVVALIAVIGELVRNWDKIKETAVKVWEAIKKAWNQAGEWFNKNIVQPISKFFSGLWSGIKTTASNAWNGITGAFKSAANWFNAKVVQPISKFFSGLWNGIKTMASNAWNGILNLFSSGGKIFSGVVDGVAGVFKTVVNTLISGINTIIAAPFNTINGLLNTIRGIKVMGIEPFKSLWKENPLPVPEIPKLAQGGFVEKNTPQLAMIGDNRHQGEIVSPEDKLMEMARLAASEGGSPVLLRKIIELLETLVSLVQGGDDIVLAVDGEELARALMTGTLRLKRRYTTVEVTVS